MPERFIGRTLGKYRVESLLGTGGFAWVFAAKDPDLDISVALKVLKPQYAGDKEFEERFRREASTAARLKHPNIIKIYAVGSDQSCVYFAMDLYTQKLTQQLDIMGTIPEPGVLKLGLDVSSALGFAHRQGVIHRDIKTDNILFDDHGNAIVADFGIARAAADYAEHTGTNMIMGTPQYFAPEQARGHKIDSRADIYSLGVTLFAASTGELPFDGTDWYEIATKHVHEKPPAPRSLNPIVSVEMERIILKCLEKNRDDRYESADLLYSEFESLARKRASEDSSATIVVSTPVTGRYHAIKSATAEPKSRFLLPLLFVLMFVLAAGLFALVDSFSVQNRFVARTNGAVVSGNIEPVEPGRSGGDSGAVSPGTLPGSQQTGTAPPIPLGTNPMKHVFSVTAPDSAEISLNNQLVGVGRWQTDTLGAGTYRVSAQLTVRSECVWGKDSVTVNWAAQEPRNYELRPRRCGEASIVAFKGDSDQTLDARYDIVLGEGTVPLSGRITSVAPIILPAGSHKLSVSAPNCYQFNDPLIVVADSLVRRIIRMTCY